MAGVIIHIFLPAFAIPFSVAVIVLLLRKQFHDLWTPAVDVFAVLFASEAVILYEHDKLPPPAFGVDLVSAFTLLLTITAPLLVGSLIVENGAIRSYIFRRLHHQPAAGSGSLRNWTIVLWGAAISIFAGHLALLLSGSVRAAAIAVSPQR